MLWLLGQKSRESTEEEEVKSVGAEQGGYMEEVTHELSLEMRLGLQADRMERERAFQTQGAACAKAWRCEVAQSTWETSVALQPAAQ